jgi:hypothetical protein
MQITGDLEALDDLLSEVDLSLKDSGGEVTPEIGVAMKAVDAIKAGLSEEFERKVDNLAGYIRMLETRSAGRLEEAERMTKMAKRDQANADWLKLMLKGELQARNIKKLDLARFKVSVVNNGGLLPLIVEQGIKDMPERAGERYWVAVTTNRLLTDEIRKDLEAGKVLNFAHLGERGTRLAIR